MTWFMRITILEICDKFVLFVILCGYVRWVRWLAACGSAVDCNSHCTQASTLSWRLGWKVFVKCKHVARKRWWAWQIVITVVLHVFKTIRVSFSH